MHFVGPDQLHGFAERRVGDHNSNWPGVSGVEHGLFRGGRAAGRERAEIGAGPRGLSVDEATLRSTLERLGELGQRRRAGDDTPFCLDGRPDAVHTALRGEVLKKNYSFSEAVGTPAIPPLPDADYHPWLREWRECTGHARAAGGREAAGAGAPITGSCAAWTG